MLTPELVRGRIRDAELHVKLLSKQELDRATEIAEALLETVREHVGKTRQELEQAFAELSLEPRERLLGEGLKKLIDDELDFAAEATEDPVVLRRELFLRAATVRRALPAGAHFDRDQVLAAVAADRGVTPGWIEQALYSDLRGAQVLQSAPRVSAPELVRRYDPAQLQAVLLRAVKLHAEVRCASPAAYRALFHKLKFRRLLYAIHPLEQGYRIEIDGPFSLFESVTKYGLALALVLPALLECEALTLVAEVRWGPRRQRAAFKLEHRARGASAEDSEVRLPDDVSSLVDAVRALDTEWTVEASTALLELPGIGVCVPDLAFKRKGSRDAVYLEVLGYWSRDAVWRRVELAQQGLGARVLFAVSSRLRVSEAVLDAEDAAALYVYKGTMSARAVLERVAALAPKRAGSRKKTR